MCLTINKSVINTIMHKTAEGILYSIEVNDQCGAVLILYDAAGNETRLEDFTSIRSILNYVNDLDSWERSIGE